MQNVTINFQIRGVPILDQASVQCTYPVNRREDERSIPFSDKHPSCLLFLFSSETISQWAILQHEMRRNHSLRVYARGSCLCGGPKLLRKMAAIVKREIARFTNPFPPLPPCSPTSLGPPRTWVQIVEDICIGDPHPNFRLWLSSGPHPKFPISILRRGLKMTTEPPAGLRANVSTLYNIVSQVSEMEG